MPRKFIGRIKYSIRESDEYNWSPPKTEELPSLSRLHEYLEKGKSGVLVAESGRGRTYISHCIRFEQEISSDNSSNKKIIVFSLADYVEGGDVAAMFPLEHRIEQLDDKCELAVILDGYEHLIRRKISLVTVVNALCLYFRTKYLPILLTCLPVDNVLNEPAKQLGTASDIFEAEVQPMNADEFEEYLKCEQSTQDWQTYSESNQEYIRLIAWLEEQGLMQHCRKPSDLVWLLEVRRNHEEAMDNNFVGFSNVIEEKIINEIAYAKRHYGDFDLNLAQDALEELAALTVLSGQKGVQSGIYQYPISLNGNSLISLLRCGLFHSNKEAWEQHQCSLNWQVSDWLIARFLERKLRQGMSQSSLWQHINVQVGEKKQLHQGLSGASVFLAIDFKQEYLLKNLVDAWPESIVDRGDPSKLENDLRQVTLINAREQFRGKRFAFNYQPEGIKRFITPNIETYVSHSIDDVLNSASWIDEEQEYLRLLCSLIQQGKIRRCVNQLLRVLERNLSSDSSLWEECIACVAAIGDSEQRNRLKDFIAPPSNQVEVSREEMHSYAGRLYHLSKNLLLNEISLDEFINNLGRLTNIQTNESASGLATYMSYVLWEKLSRKGKDTLINGLNNLLSKEDGSLNDKYRWFIHVLANLVENYFQEYESSDCDIALSAMDKLIKWRQTIYETNSINYVSSVLSIAVRNLLEIPNARILWLRKRYTNQGNLSFHQLIILMPDVRSHELAMDLLSDNSFPTELRLSAINYLNVNQLQDIESVDTYPKEVRETIQQQIERIRSAAEAQHPPVLPEENWWVQHQNKQQEQHRIEIEHYTEHLDEIRSGQYLGALQALTSLHGPRTDLSYFPCQEIEERYNQEIAQAAKQGVVAVLDNYRLPCKIFSTDNTERVISGFILQAIELERDSIPYFSGQRLHNAAAALTWELNQLPKWSDRLVRHHEPLVRNVIDSVIRAESVMQNDAETHGSLHEFLTREGRKLSNMCWPLIREQLLGSSYVSAAYVSIAAQLAIRNNDRQVAQGNIEQLLTTDSRNTSLLAYYLAIVPDEGVNRLEHLLQEDVEKNQALIRNILSFFSSEEAQKLLERVWGEAGILVRFLKLFLQVLPNNHDQMPEGVYTVTPEVEVSHLYKAIISSLSKKLTYEQGKQLAAEIRSDPVFNGLWWVDYIEQAIFYRESNRTFQSKEIRRWLQSNWVQSIRTIGQLHNYIIELLEDIRSDISNNDFSLKLIWQGLHKGKIRDNMNDETKRCRNYDRTEEEYVQVWLANELQRRSAGRLVVKREDQTNNSTRRDISISIPGVGSCVIEIKVTNKGRYSSFTKLRDTLATQIPMYVRDAGYRTAILFLFKSDAKTYNLPTRGNGQEFEKLLEELEEIVPNLKKDSDELNNLEALSIFGIKIQEAI